MLLLVDICQMMNPTRALALFGETKRGNIEWGWEVSTLNKLFSTIVTKKTSLTSHGVRSSWYGHGTPGHDKAMWIHHFFVMQFVHPYFRPPRDWDFVTRHEHFRHCEIKFLHKKWHKFIRMVDDEDVVNYQNVSGVNGRPKYTMLWKGELWSAPQTGTHFGED